MNRTYSGMLCGALVLVWASGAARADHWRSAEEVARAAHVLSERAEHFHQVAHDLTGYSHLAGDAHRFADSAEHFHQAVEPGASYRHMLADYRQLKRDFFHLRGAFRQAHDAHHNPHAVRDWQRMVVAFEDLQMAMGDRSERRDHDHDHDHHR